MTLAEKYNVAMNRLELSAEARQRILGNIQGMGLDTPKRGKVFPFPRWKQWATLAACAAVVLLAAITLANGMIHARNNETIASPHSAVPALPP